MEDRWSEEWLESDANASESKASEVVIMVAFVKEEIACSWKEWPSDGSMEIQFENEQMRLVSGFRDDVYDQPSLIFQKRNHSALARLAILGREPNLDGHSYPVRSLDCATLELTDNRHGGTPDRRSGNKKNADR
jgi:hypothetical protein